jgi:hypothetical protein
MDKPRLALDLSLEVAGKKIKRGVYKAALLDAVRLDKYTSDCDRAHEARALEPQNWAVVTFAGAASAELCPGPPGAVKRP